MKTLLYILVLFGISYDVGAQTISDALRYSQYQITGTARNMGMGGTLTSIGADLSAVGLNPAGTATFRKSRISFTPLSETKKILTSFAGNNLDRKSMRFALSQFGFVSVNQPLASDWKLINFSLAYNQLNNFNENFEFSGASKGSISDRWLEQSRGFSPDQFNPFEEGLAADAGVLVLVDSTNWSYTTDYQDYNHGKPLQKRQSVQTTGSMSRLSMNIAGNYREKLQVGVGLNIDFVFYTPTKTYIETRTTKEEIKVFEQLKYKELLNTSGSGVNLSIGAIYRPIHPIFLSVALTTPTAWTLNDTYSSELDYSYEDNGTSIKGNAQSPEGSFQYGLRTPLRLQAGGGYIIRKSGMLTTSIEWVSYGNARFDLTQESDNSDDLIYQDVLNRDLPNAYSSAISIKIGGEYAKGPWRLRGGYILQQHPYANDNKFDTGYSFGGGLNSNRFFIDAAVMLQTQNAGYVPYLTKNKELYPTQLVELHQKNLMVNMTLGWRL